MRPAAVVVLLAALPALPAELFVAPNGKDASPGTLAAPLATPQEAQRRARRLLAEGQPVTITLRGGVYPLSQAMVFGGSDSGTAERPATWQAYRGERPILDGGRRITGWRREGKLWAVTLPEVRAGRWSFNQLFVNGRRAQRARTPNEGFLTIAGYDAPGTDPQGKPVNRERTAFVYKPGDLEEWPNLEDAVVVVTPRASGTSTATRARFPTTRCPARTRRLPRCTHRSPTSCCASSAKPRWACRSRTSPSAA
ncbi:MAG: hypothetical protein HYU66_05770 [Armatimonadetes bacterium]|nr:hypothetical protein [Armatimonadota bacterium]